MAQYRVGFVEVALDSNVVIGTGTFWDEDSVVAGNSFSALGEAGLYTIASVDYATQTLLLASNYAGVPGNKAYFITRDFTPNFSIPEVSVGDMDWPLVVTEAFRKIDNNLGKGGAGRASITTQPEPPLNPIDKQLWIDSDDNFAFSINIDMGNPSTITQFDPLIDRLIDAGTPAELKELVNG